MNGKVHYSVDEDREEGSQSHPLCPHGLDGRGLADLLPAHDVDASDGAGVVCDWLLKNIDLQPITLGAQFRGPSNKLGFASASRLKMHSSLIGPNVEASSQAGDSFDGTFTLFHADSPVSLLIGLSMQITRTFFVSSLRAPLSDEIVWTFRMRGDSPIISVICLMTPSSIA